MSRLAGRYNDCGNERNASLVRYDIQCVMRRLADVTGDASVREVALSLVELEINAKYRKNMQARGGLKNTDPRTAI
jgi:hypothetical protein